MTKRMARKKSTTNKKRPEELYREVIQDVSEDVRALGSLQQPSLLESVTVSARQVFRLIMRLSRG